MLATVLYMALAAPVWRGVDCSFIPQLRDLGAKFYDGADETEVLVALRKQGINLLRLRVWVDPKDGYCGVERTLKLSKEAFDLGYTLMIDFHYSDSWADPAKQVKPRAWRQLSERDLAKAVHDHTKLTLEKLVAQKTPARFVQIGNEVRPGMLFPTGRINGNDYAPFARLLKAGLTGAREAMRGKPLTTIIHNDEGGNFKGTSRFFEGLAKEGVKFDCIGLSYYPWWHGTLAQLSENLNGLASKFNKPVMVVETAYPFTLKWQDDENNFVGTEKQLVPGYPATPEGQASFLQKVNDLVTSVPNGRDSVRFIGLLNTSPCPAFARLAKTWHSSTSSTGCCQAPPRWAVNPNNNSNLGRRR